MSFIELILHNISSEFEGVKKNQGNHKNKHLDLGHRQ